MQIVQLHAVFRSLRIEHVELVEFFVEGLLNLLVPFAGAGFLEQLLPFGRAFTIAQFLLDVLDLLLQEILTLLLVEVFAGTGTDVLLQHHELNVAMQVAEYLEKTLLGGVACEQLDFVADGEGH